MRNGFNTVLQVDMYAVFNELYHDAHIRTPSALTEESLKQIGELYAIEAEIKEDADKTKPCRTSAKS
ncbi:hypothetical protein K3E05_002341 [Escherichia coli]|nr:hypothetical protein [Escherichia coli]